MFYESLVGFQPNEAQHSGVLHAVETDIVSVHPQHRQAGVLLVAHRLYVCLDAQVHDETIAALTADADNLFICLDAALSDEAKVRLEDGRRVKVI
ncbi:hypothetical protein [Caldilinea sp.]|jgi:hypothetical protein|uniref:hypothetical protein n=1 Tax=Caldilinea sp. TaxID=2293560 RepID=UPI00261D53AA|nr:hypothetical protein [uncultured Caldilinea sp.]